MEVGDRVELLRLSENPAFNGKTGVIRQWINSSGRWAVKLDDDTSGKLKCVLPSNLKRQDCITMAVVPETGNLHYIQAPVTAAADPFYNR